MTEVYKLTDANDHTKENTQWGPNVTPPPLDGHTLCKAGVYHAYRHPLLAVLLDPVYANYGSTAHLWRAEGIVVVEDGLKVGCSTLTTLERMDLPIITTEQRVRFAIACTWPTISGKVWRQWATDWLTSKDRSAAAAKAAARSWAAETEAGESAEAEAAKAAARAAKAKAKARAAKAKAKAEEEAAKAVVWAEEAAMWAAKAVVWAEENHSDFAVLAEWAMTDSTEVPE